MAEQQQQQDEGMRQWYEMEVVGGPLMSGPDVPVGNSPGYGSSFATQEFRQFSHEALPWREWADLDEHMDTFCYQYYSASSDVVSEVVSEAQQEIRKLVIFKHNGASGAWCNLGPNWAALTT